MKKTIYLLSLVIPLFMAISCEDKPDDYKFPVDKYFYEIPDVPVTEDYVIGVPYNVVDSGYWFNKSTNRDELYTGHPLLGEYNTKYSLPEILPQHLKWGKEAGIDFFIVSWGGHGWNDTLLTRWGELYAQDNQLPRVVIRFDPGYMMNRKFKGTNDTLQLNPARMDSLRFDIDSIYTHVMSKDYAYKDKNNNPVMVLCNFTNKPESLVDLHKFTNEFRTIANNKLWMMGEVGGNWSSPEYWGYRDETTKGVVKGDTIGAFDAVFITDVATSNKDRFDGYYSFMDVNYRYWQERMRTINKEYIPMIFPSFDNKAREAANTGNYIIPRYSEEKNEAYIITAAAEYNEGVEQVYNLTNYKQSPYKILGNVAKRNVGQSRIILVYSWNDFRNGNNLEPTKEINDDYLRYTKKYFKR